MKVKSLVGLLGGAAALLGSIGNTNAEKINLTLTNLNQPLVQIWHNAAGSENRDSYDNSFNPPTQTTAFEFFSKAAYDPSIRLRNQGFPLNSFTTVTNEIWGKNMWTPTNAYLRVSITDPNLDKSFTNKTILLDVYFHQSSTTLVGTHELKTIALTNGSISLPAIVTGHSYTLVVRFVSNNLAPANSDSSSTGPKLGVRTGTWPVGDSDGIVTNVYTLGDLPSGFTNNGASGWTWNPGGVAVTNLVQNYAVDNAGAYSTTNMLTLVATNDLVAKVLYPARITSIGRDDNSINIGALVSPGYSHVLEGRANLNSGFWMPLRTNTVAFEGDTNAVGSSYTVDVVQGGAEFYTIESRE